MRFRIVEKRLKKQYSPKGAYGKMIYILQYRTLFTGWRYVSFKSDDDGTPLLYFFHKYEHAYVERRRLSDINALRLFGKPRIK